VMSGAAYMSGWPDQPVKNLAPWADYGTGYALAFATMTALYHRQITGVGQMVEGALLRTALTMIGRELMEEAVLDANRPPTLNRGQTSGPSDVFPTKDGHVIVSVVGERQFKRWAELMGEEHWLHDERFVDDPTRGLNYEPLCERLAQWCAERTTAQAVDELVAAQLPAGPVYRPGETLVDPHIKAMGFLVPVDYPGVDRPAPTADFPVTLSATPGHIRFRAPLVSEHTEAILTDLGYSDAEIDNLRAQRII
jgi:crotonobetainyl-CoA:carnitine CoA-transferase CaiB-like acyl-CoA transferase